ncbi:AAA family ATPase [Bacillus gaemokensis]|uniref:RecD/TraA family helicase n=1 Tax=Bacillus gaemokensis TaxID=574375 RepID=A0A073K9H6_9BACI|nr:AAA family ATPase [Bacillus gaemokensis]KEK23914.1 RecD/TraA family helicase [Bacillus gaemokensis]KYG38037.1 RecD/TraA family helicase [Bacillus gaemokensis]
MTTIKGTAKLQRVTFSKGDFVIGGFKPIDVEGDVEVNPKYGTFSMKGNMPAMIEDAEYYFEAEAGQRHPQYGLGYDLIFIRQNVNLDVNSPESVKEFLEIVLTKRQVNALYEAFDNPIEVIERKDVQELTKAKGIGLAYARKIIEHYESQKDYSHAYIELGKHGLKPKTIKKIVDHYGSPELAVEKISENPYSLIEIDGFAFKKCDEIFINMGGDKNSEVRIKEFLIYVLKEEASKGHTWMTPMNLIIATNEYIPTVDKALVGRMMLADKETFYFSEDKGKISLTAFVLLEKLVAGQLGRILSAENTFDYKGWEDVVDTIEDTQGWKFTEQQRDEAMVMMLENNISILQGYGGTGKTTTLKAVADVLEQKGYLYAQCALSGKASSNLALVTGKDGSTIHRLLNYIPFKGFYYNQNNPLPYDIIILDEVSMVDAKLFASLLLAIRTGAKLIMLGDSQQLESIGVPVMMPMIQSGVIPTMTLTQIHRQAQKSAVVTDSIAIRQGVQVVKERLGRVTHGELQDLEYELVLDDDKIFLEVMKEFHKHIQNNDIMDVQILTQQREKGKTSCLLLNKSCQKIYNPEAQGKKYVQIGKEDTGYILRKGDKVINVRNNYQAVDENDRECPVFNGNVGMLIDFDIDENDDEYMLIDFEGIGLVKVYEEFYNSIELAYAITVHKSQGSSSKIIIVALPYHYTLNSRQLFYTAITRTREHCVVVATKKTISSAISKDVVSKKRTYLAGYLKEMVA